MKRIIPAIILLACLPTALSAEDPDSLAFARADWSISALPKGGEVRTASIAMFGGIQTVSIASYPSGRYRTGIVEGEGLSREELTVKRGHASHASRTSALAGAAKGKIAINGNYFNMRSVSPVSYTRIGKTVYGRTSPAEAAARTKGVFAMNRSGRRVDIFSADTVQCDATVPEWYGVMAAGPVLIEEGVPCHYTAEDGFYDKRHPRSLAGYTLSPGGKTGRIYMIVIDGRFPGKADGASIEECVKICRYLGLHEAINLDGGGSSTLWTSETGVVNHPGDNRKWDHEGERPVPNILVAR